VGPLLVRSTAFCVLCSFNLRALKINIETVRRYSGRVKEVVGTEYAQIVHIFQGTDHVERRLLPASDGPWKFSCTERTFVESMNLIVPPHQKMRKALQMQMIPATGAPFPLAWGVLCSGVGHEGYRSDLRSSIAASRSHYTFDSPRLASEADIVCTTHSATDSST
jgi:hypothetical protein